MNFLPRCEKHPNRIMPCMDCVIEDGWREAGGKGPPPAKVYHRAAEAIGASLDFPHAAVATAGVPDIPWKSTFSGWRATLMDGVELEVSDNEAWLSIFNSTVKRETIRGSEPERKFAAIAMASNYLTLVLSRLASVY